MLFVFVIALVTVGCHGGKCCISFACNTVDSLKKSMVRMKNCVYSAPLYGNCAKASLTLVLFSVFMLNGQIMKEKKIKKFLLEAVNGLQK